MTLNKHFTGTGFLCVISGLLLQASEIHGSGQAREAIITVHLRGVHESKISLLSLSGANAQKPISIVQIVKKGETITLQVPEDNLPGEFVLRFDYKENTASTPYPSEKLRIHLFVICAWTRHIFAETLYFKLTF